MKTLELEIIGGNKTLRKYIEDAFFVAYYDLFDKETKLIIQVEISKNLDNDADGYCMMYTKKEFIIELKKSNLEEMVKTVFHEMTHVKQYNSKELKAKKKNYVWRGKKYSYDYPYEKMPWERMANNVENLIYERISNV